MNIDEVIADADNNNPNHNTRVMVNLAELKALREAARRPSSHPAAQGKEDK